MIQRKTPLKRSTRPLKRTPLPRRTNTLGRGAKARSASPRALKRRKDDRLWQEAVCEGKTCAVCGGLPVSGHHLIFRRYAKTRHDVRVGVPLCFEHHRWAHDKPLEFGVWMWVNLPEKMEWAEELKEIK